MTQPNPVDSDTYYRSADSLLDFYIVPGTINLLDIKESVEEENSTFYFRYTSLQVHCSATICYALH